jgi:hypothetical protein
MSVHQTPLLWQNKKQNICLYVKKLADIDQEVLTQLIKQSVDHLRRQYPDK